MNQQAGEGMGRAPRPDRPNPSPFDSPINFPVGNLLKRCKVVLVSRKNVWALGSSREHLCEKRPSWYDLATVTASNASL